MTLNMQELGNLVRQWVHFDTLVETLNRQISVERQRRERYEQEILGRLKASNYEHAIIQIAGGRISATEVRHSQGLTFKLLEELLHNYYTQKPGPYRDETADILKFIKSNRGSEVTKRLKRQMTSGTTPLPSDSTPGSGPKV